MNNWWEIKPYGKGMSEQEHIMAGDFVQVRNPRSMQYVLIDRDRGVIVARNEEPASGVKVLGE